MSPSQEGDMVVLTQGRLVARIGAATPVRALHSTARGICKSRARPWVLFAGGSQATPPALLPDGLFSPHPKLYS